MKPGKRQLINLVHRIAYAALISALVWILARLPMQLNPYGPGALLLLALDWPIAVATQPLPCKEFAIDLWFTVEGGEGCPSGIGYQVPAWEMFVNHMRVGIPVYVFLFYVPNILIGSVRWWRGRGRPESPSRQ